MKRAVRILESKVICRQAGRYIGWPTIGRTPGGEVIAVFSGDRDAHVDPFGKTFLVRSSDGGKTWSDPELVNDTPLDDRDTGLCICRDGALVVSWFTSLYDEESYMRRCPQGEEDRWRAHLANVTRADIVAWGGERIVNGRYQLGCWIRRSVDGGRTWQDPVRVPPTAPHGPIELSDGRLMFVGVDTVQGRGEREGSIVAAESPDQGATWSVIGRTNMYPEYEGDAPGGVAYLCEPHVVEVAPGKLRAMARHEEVPHGSDRQRCVLWQFTSDDGGHTWTEPRPTQILGKPPHLTRLLDGRLLVTYGYRHEPYGERACLSRDGGKTWDYENEIVLRDDAPSGDLGYPASVDMGDGTVLTVYYQQDAPGEKTCLMTTHWEPGE